MCTAVNANQLQTRTDQFKSLAYCHSEESVWFHLGQANFVLVPAEYRKHFFQYQHEPQSVHINGEH